MRRKYTRDTLQKILSKLSSLKREDGILINIGADLIVGFPGETEQDFEDTLSLVKDFGITGAHAFPFSSHSEKRAVPAARLPNQVTSSIKDERMVRLLEASEQTKNLFLQKNTSARFSMIVETGSNEKVFSGWSENHIHLDTGNFFPDPNQLWKRGKSVIGTYKFKSPS